MQSRKRDPLTSRLACSELAENALDHTPILSDDYAQPSFRNLQHHLPGKLCALYLCKFCLPFPKGKALSPFSLELIPQGLCRTTGIAVELR